MHETILGTLAIRLALDPKDLEKGARESSKRMKKWSDEMSAATRAAAASFVAMGAGIALAVRGMVNEANKMGRVAQSLGIPVEKLTALKYAAEQADIPFETLSASLTKFNQSLGQIASGEVNSAATALNALGISATNSSGALRSNTDLMSDVADKFARLKDDASKASIAMALFGEQGVKLTPLLNQGASGIKDLTDEAERLGVVITQDTARKAAEFNQALQKIGAAGRGAALALTERLLPDMKLIADAVARAAEESKPFMIALDGIALAAKAISTLFAAAAGNLTLLIGGLRELYAFNRDFVTLGWDKAIEASTKRINELKKSLGGIANLIGGMWGAEGDQDRFGFAGKMGEAGVQVPQALAPAMQSVADLNAEFTATRESARMLFTELLESPTETFEAKLAAITQAARDGVIGFHEYGQAVKQVARENEQQLDTLVAASTGALNSLFAENKAVGIATALVNTYQAITKALASSPPPMSYALAAATAAQGFAQVQAIRNTSKSGSGGSAASASGGGASSGGGGAGAGGGGSDSAGIQRSLFVQGLNPNDLFTGSQVANIAELLLEHQRNGGTILLEGR